MNATATVEAILDAPLLRAPFALETTRREHGPAGQSDLRVATSPG
jgi:hypothetical protein